jgi:hypothetical protein
VGAKQTAAALAAAAALVLGACTDDGGATEDFCTEVRSLPSLEAVLSRFDEADPADLDDRITKARDAYHDLADAAPTEVAEATDSVVDLVDDILDAVDEHPDDPAAAAAELREVMDEHEGVEEDRTEVAEFAEERCDVELDPTLSGSNDDGTAATTSTSEVAPTSGLDPTTTTPG